MVVLPLLLVGQSTEKPLPSPAGANAVTPEGAAPSNTVFNYFVGDESTWRTDVVGYEAVVYTGLYDGVDLQVSGHPGGLKYEFDVAPGADYGQILVSYSGIEGLSLAADGSPRVPTAAGELVEAAPEIYQVIDGQKVDVSGQFVLVGATSYAYKVAGSYDPVPGACHRPRGQRSCFFGGSSEDKGLAVAMDSSGNAVVTGYPYSSNFGSANNSFKGIIDVFVAKLSTDNYGQVLWATYLEVPPTTTAPGSPSTLRATPW